MLRTVPGREEFARVAYRGLKPTATVNGRYEPVIFYRTLYHGRCLMVRRISPRRSECR